MSDVYYDYLDTPVGRLLLVLDGQGLRRVHFENGRYPLRLDKEWERGPGALHEARTQLKAYFAGKLKTFDLPLAPEGSEFQQQTGWNCCAFLMARPRRTVKSPPVARRDVARVGAANGQNPLAIVIPCHRVVGATAA